MGAGATFDRATLLLSLFLLSGIAAPTAAVLWFMNAAASSQEVSARQKVMEAYRGQLRLIRDRVDADWETRAAELAKQAIRGTQEDFARIIGARDVDSLVLLRADGAPSYPSLFKNLSPDTAADRADWRAAQAFEQRREWQAALREYSSIAKSILDPSLAARAAQGQIRCLLQIDKSAAFNAVLEYFASGRLVNAPDLDGRMIAADEHLLALRLLPASDRRRAIILQRLIGWINDYKSPMPSAQRLFLMSERAGTGVLLTKFPTYEAEKLAAQTLEGDQVRPGSGLESIRVPDVWKLTAKGGRAVALLRSSTVTARMRQSLTETNTTRGASFTMIPPGVKQQDESIAAGPMLPGWQVAFTLQDDRWLTEAGRRRTASYFAAGYVVIALLCASGLLLGQVFRRQMRLTRLKTDLVATVSHELKTPLASMRLLVDALLEDNSPDPRKTREYLQLISGENLRLTRLIENFLTFSRIERRRQSFEFTETEPQRIVETAGAAVRERFPVEIEIEPGLSLVHADEDALVTALLNLLDNAFKYTPSEKHIALRAYQQGGDVVFAVEDNGIGISPREQKRIFRKFYQVDRRLARETGGCGLGLSIVDYIVRAHGGSVRVRSQVGGGSTFFVSLPIAGQPASLRPSGTDPHPGIANRPTDIVRRPASAVSNRAQAGSLPHNPQL
jgi:signal transduction histidine kinase